MLLWTWVYPCFQFFEYIYPEVELLDNMIILFSILLGGCTILQSICAILHSCYQLQEFQFSSNAYFSIFITIQWVKLYFTYIWLHFHWVIISTHTNYIRFRYNIAIWYICILWNDQCNKSYHSSPYKAVAIHRDYILYVYITSPDLHILRLEVWTS